MNQFISYIIGPLLANIFISTLEPSINSIDRETFPKFIVIVKSVLRRNIIRKWKSCFSKQPRNKQEISDLHEFPTYKYY